MAKHPEDYIAGKTGAHDKYDNGQTLGSYQTSDKQFPNPKGVVVFAGFGADKNDLERGYCRPAIVDNPRYDADNYKQRWTLPIASDLTEQGPEIPSDDEFRNHDRYSKGFLVRPHIPTER